MNTETEAEALAAILKAELWDRGNNVKDWPADEAKAYRALGWSEGVEAMRDVMFAKAAAAILASGFRRIELGGNL